MPTTEH